MTKDKVTALYSLFRYNKTIDYYIRSQYQDMRTSRLVTLGDLTSAVGIYNSVLIMSKLPA
jgi:hypothetical protein